MVRRYRLGASCGSEMAHDAACCPRTCCHGINGFLIAQTARSRSLRIDVAPALSHSLARGAPHYAHVRSHLTNWLLTGIKFLLWTPHRKGQACVVCVNGHVWEPRGRACGAPPMKRIVTLALAYCRAVMRWLAHLRMYVAVSSPRSAVFVLDVSVVCIHIFVGEGA
mmetsp:Transcript_8992/g.27496  ORF Transcript_8992/g.27496 Transcript_8992/m.27496 type:complete len:166 (-) Transcript_8992:6-503(-)